MDYRYGIETIDVLIDSLEQTKQQLKTNDLLSLQLYDNFDILSLIYQSMIELYGEECNSNHSRKNKSRCSFLIY